MIRLPRLQIPLIALVLLAGCGGIPKHPINPPNASIQQLDVLPDGSWKLQIRLENFSDSTVRYGALKASLMVEGRVAGDISLNPNLDIPGQNADIVETSIIPASAAQQALSENVNKPGGASYVLRGTINVPAADKDFKFNYRSSLSPVPGIANQYR